MAYENRNFTNNRDDNRSENQGENREPKPESRGENRNESLFSKRIKAGKRRTYFFDVRATRGNDYFITITESKKRFDDNGYDRHKMFLYKEDFNKFLAGLAETITFVKTDLMADFDFDAFSHEQENEEGASMVTAHADVHEAIPELSAVAAISEGESVEEWKM